MGSYSTEETQEARATAARKKMAGHFGRDVFFAGRQAAGIEEGSLAALGMTGLFFLLT
jgi:predicted lipid-binding transport protein (Tim44 family)